MATKKDEAAAAEKPERKPRDKKPVIIERMSDDPKKIGAGWHQDGEEEFADTAAAEKHLAESATEGHYRILTVQRQLTVKVETVTRAVLE